MRIKEDLSSPFKSKCSRCKENIRFNVRKGKYSKCKCVPKRLPYYGYERKKI